jgi:hypothetical protein
MAVKTIKAGQAIAPFAGVVYAPGVVSPTTRLGYAANADGYTIDSATKGNVRILSSFLHIHFTNVCLFLW